MKRQWSIPGILVGACVAVMLAAAPAFAQLGSLQGRIVDEAGQPVADAEVTLEYRGELNIKYQVKTNAEGMWTRAGLMAVGGLWTITASKDGAAGFASNVDVPLSAARTIDDIVIRKGAVAPGADMDAAEAEARNAALSAIKVLLDEVNVAVKAEDYATAVAKLNEAIVKLPNCDGCYAQLGDVYSRQNMNTEAETAFKKAIELNPESAMSWDGLAALYNTTGRLPEAAEAAAKAMELNSASGGGDATSAYNAGAIMMNSGKVAEAKAQFQRAIQLDPKMAEAHFQLGMTFINEGNVGEAITSLEQYLALAPDGPNSQMAKDMLPELKKMQ